jgi:putative NADH-flavin reductase
MADDRETGMVSVGRIGPSIAILGASGLIGQAVADDLARRGFAIAAVARGFTRGQRDAFGDDLVERPFVSLGADELAEFVSRLNADVVVNCVGVLQDGARGRAKDVHAGFVARLVEAIEAANHPMLLVHLSIPSNSAARNGMPSASSPHPARPT